jgi:KipI family sensor histidine kinase inhibitor
VRLRRAGERGVLAEVADLDGVHRLVAGVRAAGLSGVVDVVPGYRTVLVTTVDATSLAAVRSALPRLALPAAAAAASRLVEVPVHDDGADLGEVAARTGLSRDEVVTRHTAPDYLVAFLGFAPGFPYLVGLDPALHVPRRATPRTSVPAGAVGLAGEQTGIYPRATPGGWQLIGRTDVVLFDPDRDPPALLSPGDRLRFRVAS